MAGVILKGDGFVGITDARRRAIYEAERSAAAMGVLPDEKDKRDAIIARLERRLSRAGRGWGMEQQETVVRVDDLGVAHIIPKSEATGWMDGLPAHRATQDVTSRSAQVGRQRPYTEQVAFADPGPIMSVSPREAAARFHARISAEMARTGYIPAALRQELLAEGWKLGQPVSSARLEQWCSDFQVEHGNKYPRR